MPVVISAKTSTNPGNFVRVGSDSGLYYAPSAVGTSSPHYVLDNSVTASGQAGIYTLGFGSIGSGQLVYVNIWPLMFTKSCRITGMSAAAWTVSAGVSLYNTIYASSIVTGAPTTKVVDLSAYQWSSAVSTTVTPFNFSMTDTTTTYQAGVLYWVATYFVGGTAPTIQVRTSAASMAALRSPTLPTAATSYTGNQAVSYADSSGTGQFTGSTSSSPAVLTVPNSGAVVAGGPSQFIPHYFWQLTNS